MFSKKIKITLTLTIILLFSIVSIAQAAPPLQGGKGVSQGHALKLDANGNNLGAAVSGIKDQAQADDGRIRPAVALASYFNNISYEEIMALHEGGVGFGKIAQALYFSEKFDLGMGAAELITTARQSGWGKTLRDNGIHPGSLGKGHQSEHAGAKFNNGQGNGNNGQGLNNGNNGNKGQGKGKNKGGSRDDEADVDSNDDATDVDNDDATDVDNDDNGNGKGKGKGKGNNGNSHGNGNSNGNSHGNGNSNSNGNSNGNNDQGNTTDDNNTKDGGNEN